MISRARVRRKQVAVAGHHVNVFESGAGSIVLIIPSPLTVARSYLPTIRSLSSQFRAMVVDLPGTGSASRLVHPWKMEHYARWVDEAIHVLDARDVTIVGHSNSGAIGLLLATMRPSRVSRLVLADSIGADRSLSLSRIVTGRAVDAGLEYEITFQSWHHVFFNLAFHWRNFWNQVRLSGRIDVTPCAPAIRIPTLLAWGGRDFTMPLRCAQLYQDLLPDAQLYVSHEGSHDWIVDRPDEFAHALGRFIESSDSSRLASFANDSRIGPSISASAL